jgi:hypothetical protein
MAVILVNTLDDATPPAPPAFPTLTAGLPLDFEFYARRAYPNLAPAKAVEKALKDFRESVTKLRGESVVGNESVVTANLLTSPCLYAARSTLLHEERIPEEWLSIVRERKDLIDQVIHSVCRVQLHHFVPSQLGSYGYEVGLIIGTGFVVADWIIMTNRHVAELFAQAKSSTFSFRRDGRGDYEPVITVDFAGAYDEVSDAYRVDKVLYMAPNNRPDVALLSVQPSVDRPLPPPLPLQTQKPDAVLASRRVLVCGYPTSDSSDSRVPNLFRILRVKRASLGELLGEGKYEEQSRLFHKCTTLGGSSGSPLVDLETGSVWGLHFFGRVQSLSLGGNLAEPIWHICSIPKLRELLGEAALAAPAPLAPLGGGPTTVAEKQQSRPVLFVHGNDIAPGQPFPSEWLQPNSPEHDTIRRALAAVGQVQYEEGAKAQYEGPGPVGFLIGPGVFLTVELTMDEPRPGRRPYLSVDFAKSVLNEPARRFPVTRILYASASADRNGGLGLTILKLGRQAGRSLPPWLPLEVTKPSQSLDGEAVFVVGHPLADIRSNAPAVFSRVFPPPFGVKRLALGTILKSRRRQMTSQANALGELLHDCCTAIGDAGAPVVSITSGKVLGMHEGGQYLDANFARPIWTLASDPEIRPFLMAEPK